MNYIICGNRTNDDDTINVIIVGASEASEVYSDFVVSMQNTGEWFSDDIEAFLLEASDELFRVLKEFVGVKVETDERKIFETSFRRLMVLDLVNRETDWHFKKKLPPHSFSDAREFYEKILSLFQSYRDKDEISEAIDDKLWKFVVRAEELEKNPPKTKKEKAKEETADQIISEIFSAIRQEFLKLDKFKLPEAWREDFKIQTGVLYDADGIKITRDSVSWGTIFNDRPNQDVTVEIGGCDRNVLERLLKTSLHNFSCPPSFWRYVYGGNLRELDLRETFRPIDVPEIRNIWKKFQQI